MSHCARTVRNECILCRKSPSYVRPQMCPPPLQAGTGMGRQLAGDWLPQGLAAGETEAGKEGGEGQRGWGSLKAGGRRGAAALSLGVCAALRRCRSSGLGRHREEELGFALPGRGELSAGHRPRCPRSPPAAAAAAAAPRSLPGRDGAGRGRTRCGPGRAFASPRAPRQPLCSPLHPLADPSSCCTGMRLTGLPAWLGACLN